MKARIILAAWLLAGAAHGQWVPVSANTNSGEVKPAIFSSQLNLWTNSVTAISNQFEAIKAKSITNLVSTTGAVSSVSVSNLTGYVTFGTNLYIFPDWYVPSTTNGTTNAVLWYSFDTALPAYIPDISGHGNHGREVFGGASVDMWTNYAYRLTPAQENYIQQTNSASLINGSAEMTVAMWINRQDTNFAGRVFWRAGTVSADNTCLSANLDGSETLAFYFQNAAITTAFSRITTGAWNRVVCTYKKNGAVGGAADSEQNLWINGTNYATKIDQFNAFVLVTNNWTFGKPLTALSSWNAIIDDCVLDPTAWSSNTIVEDYNAGRSVPP
jgi:hypothetical protein